MNSIKNRSKFTDLQRAGPKSPIIKMYQLRASPSNMGLGVKLYIHKAGGCNVSWSDICI